MLYTWHQNTSKLRTHGQEDLTLSNTQHLKFIAPASGSVLVGFQIVLMADEKQFVLVVVRHGQGTHNLGEDHPGWKYFPLSKTKVMGSCTLCQVVWWSGTIVGTLTQSWRTRGESRRGSLAGGWLPQGSTWLSVKNSFENYAFEEFTFEEYNFAKYMSEEKSR